MHFQIIFAILLICASLQINAKPISDRELAERLLKIAEDTSHLAERLEKRLENCENTHQLTTTSIPLTSTTPTPTTISWTTTSTPSTSTTSRILMRKYDLYYDG